MWPCCRWPKRAHSWLLIHKSAVLWWWDYLKKITVHMTWERQHYESQFWPFCGHPWSPILVLYCCFGLSWLVLVSWEESTSPHVFSPSISCCGTDHSVHSSSVICEVRLVTFCVLLLQLISTALYCYNKLLCSLCFVKLFYIYFYWS